MPHQELTGKRPSTYSYWHRKDSIKRFFGGNAVIASRLTMIDPDGIFIEAKHPYDRPPVALIEEAQVNYQLAPNSHHGKQARIMYQLGKAANIPVFLVLYLASSKPNPAYPQVPDIQEFYVKEQYPVLSKKWACMTPEEYALFLFYLRKNHIRIKKNGNQLPLIPAFDMSSYSQFAQDDLIQRWRFWFDNTEVKEINANPTAPQNN